MVSEVKNVSKRDIVDVIIKLINGRDITEICLNLGISVTVNAVATVSNDLGIEVRVTRVNGDQFIYQLSIKDKGFVVSSRKRNFVIW